MYVLEIPEHISPGEVVQDLREQNIEAEVIDGINKVHVKSKLAGTMVIALLQQKIQVLTEEQAGL